ncbi:MAG TPA: tripartite tricarboxylate transporter substrate-binding protein [Ramlibacter sp.]|uniref:Bug family tripartite tricarboxylate transporter substrate binding protein n=1 Tax=Ramlibacter sp. TaxID=1917967 RepID=UPI002D7EED5A|nr:tripartite tricarboxylate transporter substrate-binding protein [Ramlibacter sp.]HET8746250.1 tripartite tricarboxylate transporter substrate-binding protein [Ramlibacter sp.]
MRLSLFAPLVALSMSFITPAFGQDFPTRPIRFVVPFAAGGPADVVAREIGQKLGSELGQSVIVENQGGGAGVTALSTVVRSEADGHTLLFAASGNMVLQPQVSRTGGKDLVARLRPVGQVSTGPHVLVVSSKLPVANVKEFIAYAKANPGKLSYGSAGVGGVAHLGMEYLKALTGIEMTHVPYRGTSAAINDLASGQVQALFSSPPSLQGAIDKGLVKPMGMSASGGTGAARSLPVIGTVVPGFEFTTWYGLYAPLATPKPVVDRIHAALAKVLKDPALNAKLEAQGVQLAGSTPDELAATTKRDTEHWAKVIRDARITLE